MPALPAGIKFVRGPGYKKYTAILPPGTKYKGETLKREKRISFGDNRYQHYKDSVPKSKGGGLYKGKPWEHGSASRRANYRSRHGASKCKNGQKCITVKYSPAWFSYYFLW